MMTTPSIDMSLATMGTVTPEAGVETSSIPLESAGAGVASPSPEAVARFQSAMSQPLAENARVGQLFADVVSSVREVILPALGEAPESAPVVAPEVAHVGAPTGGTPVVPVGGAHPALRGLGEGESFATAPVVVPEEVSAGGRPEVVVDEDGCASVGWTRATAAVMPEGAPTGETPVVPVEGPRQVVTPAVVESTGETPVVPVEEPRMAVVPDSEIPQGARRSATGHENAMSTSAPVERPLAKKTVETPDAERLVAAGIQVAPVAAPAETAAPVQAVPDGIAPVAALSARDTQVRTDVLVEAATAVADTLLVSPSLLRGEGEVFVQLKPDVLDGSQIRITVAGKVLDVAFQTPTQDLAEMLVARLPELQQHLAAAVPAYSFNVKVAGGTGGGWRSSDRKVSD